MLGRFAYNLCNGQNMFYAPLQELDIVRYSYHQPRLERFFFNQIRKVITNANINIAKIPTNYRTNASYEVKDRIKDITLEVISTGERAMRLLFRKFFHINFSGENVTDWNLIDEVRENKLTKKVIEYAIKEEYLDKNALASKLNWNQLGTIIYLYLWKEQLIKGEIN